MAKKKKSSAPRRKNFNRNARLQSGKIWLENFEGNNVIRGYRRWFAVSEVCAIIELQLLGASIDVEVLEKAKLTEISKASGKSVANKKRRDKLLAELHEDSDDNFSFIAGYTANGVPYGTTWEETDDDSIW